VAIFCLKLKFLSMMVIAAIDWNDTQFRARLAANIVILGVCTGRNGFDRTWNRDVLFSTYQEVF
jgi:hypothetical protein